MTTIPQTPGIYRIVNLENQKFYIGSTNNLKVRKGRHFRDLKDGKHFNNHMQRAYDLYGPDTLVFEILEHIENVDTLIEREQHHIDTLLPEYNIARVAGNPTAGRKQSPEHIAKRTAKQIGRKLSPEHAAKSRVTFLNGKHTPEAKAKMSIARKGKKQSPEHITKRTAKQIGKKQSPGQNTNGTEAARIANTGKKRPPEVRAKISATKQAKKLAKLQENQPPLF